MRRLLALAILALWFSAATVLGVAQAYEYVTIPVVATRKDGQAIIGLKRNDFAVQSPPKFIIDRVVEVGPKKIALNSMPPAYPAFFLIDTLTMGLSQHSHAVQQTLTMLTRIAEDQAPITVLFVGNNGLHLVYGMQTDPKVLLQALTIVSQPKSARSTSSYTDPSVAAEVAQIRAFLDTWADTSNINAPGFNCMRLNTSGFCWGNRRPGSRWSG